MSNTPKTTRPYHCPYLSNLIDKPFPISKTSSDNEWFVLKRLKSHSTYVLQSLIIHKQINTGRCTFNHNAISISQLLIPLSGCLAMCPARYCLCKFYLFPRYVTLPTGDITTAVPVQKTSSASSNSSTATSRSST